mmetsp:Transcript_13019/g.22696  ORF Transcript_13019/g.22696 Transcript_13019/m.22696 type:complete len:80 (+) Transcript_13019:1040-1279(+)
MHWSLSSLLTCRDRLPLGGNHFSASNPGCAMVKIIAMAPIHQKCAFHMAGNLHDKGSHRGEGGRTQTFNVVNASDPIFH